MKSGLLADNRKPKQLAKDYDDREILLGSSNYLTKKEADKSKKKFPVRYQKVTSACVAFSVATGLYETEQVKLSPAFLYTQRFNKPGAGSYLYNMADIAVQQGVCKESELPTPLNEKAINNVVITNEIKQKALEHKQSSYFWIKEINIDNIVEKLNAGYPVVLATFATGTEWKKEYLEIKSKNLTFDQAGIKHAVVALPYSGFEDKGKKYFIIQDSLDLGGTSFRYVSEDWAKERITSGLYFIDTAYEFKKPEPYRFTRNLTIGSRGADVLKLQEILQDLSFFPSNVTPTGYFGGISRQAVKEFQEAYKTDILIAIGLKSGTGYFGWLTRAKLHNLLDNK